MIEEEWRDISDFAPMYQVSNLGRIFNSRHGRLVTPTKNSSGALKVKLYSECGYVTKSLKVVVAENFVDGRTDIFNTPIHLDGDQTNCQAHNLAWRPRWFAQRYSFEIRNPNYDGLLNDGPIFELVERIHYRTVREAVVLNGILPLDVYASIMSSTPVAITGQMFRKAS